MNVKGGERFEIRLYACPAAAIRTRNGEGDRPFFDCRHLAIVRGRKAGFKIDRRKKRKTTNVKLGR